MYQIDKEKFGTFLVQLRKEKSMTQKELAEQLYVSDKAVSKWERGLSLPDISLLQPMAEMLGVSVTELLSGRTIWEDQPLTVEEVEPLVTGVLTMNTEEAAQQREHRCRWEKRFLASILAFAVEVWLFRRSEWMWNDWAVYPWLPTLMALGFGVHLVFFSKEKLPALYDQYKLNFVSAGALHLNMPGVYFNNRNWPHILSAMRTWACATLAGWLPLFWLIRRAALLVLTEGQALSMAMLALTLLILFDGLFIPIVVIGKKYG